MGQCFVIGLLWMLVVVSTAQKTFCNEKLREKYCADDKTCLSCSVGPHCPLAGVRSGPDEDGHWLLRGIDDNATVSFLLEALNRQLVDDEATCNQSLLWDPDLAEAAQAWADQCALVEYQQSMPHKLRHDDHRSRSLAAPQKFLKAKPGIAQTVQWARTNQSDLTRWVVSQLLANSTNIKEGFFAPLNYNVIRFGRASHVGCGWIQFKSDKVEHFFENFLVCNFGMSRETSSSCSSSSTAKNVTFYTAPFDTINEVKACILAIRCQQNEKLRSRVYRQLGRLENQDDLCSRQLQTCLEGKSGLKIVSPLQLNDQRSRKAARSLMKSELPSRRDIYFLRNQKAAKCKIDSILCSLLLPAEDPICAEKTLICNGNQPS